LEANKELSFVSHLEIGRSVLSFAIGWVDG